jgi:hypothetical protein
VLSSVFDSSVSEELTDCLNDAKCRLLAKFKEEVHCCKAELFIIYSSSQSACMLSRLTTDSKTL